MSSNSDSKWRSSNSHRQQPSRGGGSVASTPSQQQQQQQQPPRSRPESVNYSQAASQSQTTSSAAPPPNAWIERARSISGVKGVSQPQRQSATSPAPAAATAQSGPTAKHEPVNSFNRNDVKDLFKKGFASTTAGEVGKKALFKPSGDNATKSAGGGPWGSKPRNMSNGQDFWVQLGKQVTTLEQGRGG